MTVPTIIPRSTPSNSGERVLENGPRWQSVWVSRPQQIRQIRRIWTDLYMLESGEASTRNHLLMCIYLYALSGQTPSKVVFDTPFL